MTLEEKMNELAKMKMEEGFEEGKKEGIKEGILTVARTLKDDGADIEQIIKVTKLSREEIEKL